MHMTGSWHPDEDVTPTPRDVLYMAETLEGRHGVHAADVADFFSTLHSLRGDAGRCWTWAGVAETVRRRGVDREKSHVDPTWTSGGGPKRTNFCLLISSRTEIER